MSYTRTTWANGATALSAEHMNNIEDGINEALTAAQGNSDMWSYIRNLVYPVGSIYMTASLDTVAKVEAALGGTWVKWGQGKVPVGVDTSDTDFDTVEETGGVKDAIIPSHDHTASFSGTALGTHTHTGPSHTHTGPSHTHGLNGTSAVATSAGAHTHSVSGTAASAGAHTHGTNNNSKQKFVISSLDVSNDSAGSLQSGSGYAYPYATTKSGNVIIDETPFGWGTATGSAGAHTHSISGTAASAGAHTHSLTGNTTAAGTGATGAAGTGATSAVSAGTPSGTVTVASKGESVTGKNLQPYITCFMYKRTA